VGIVVGAAAGIGSWALWLFLVALDKDRIADYLQKGGGRLVHLSCAVVGRERIYEVVYDDQAGNQHFATCKTAMGAGVYWTDDRVTHPKDESEELRQLREENARLRQQLAGVASPGTVAEAERCPACGAALLPEAARCPDCQIALR
jgi:hypothetical protein